MDDVSDKVAYFQAITGLDDPDLCTEILQAHGWDLELAISSFTGSNPPDDDPPSSGPGPRQLAAGPPPPPPPPTPTPNAGGPSLTWRIITLPVSVISGGLGLVSGAIGLGMWMAGGVLSYSLGMVGLGPGSGRRGGGGGEDSSRLVSLSAAATEAMEFVASFEREYAAAAGRPNFVSEGFMDALQRSRNAFKLLFVYLHSPDHPDTPLFCEQTLCSEALAAFVNENFVAWGGSIRASEGFKMSNSLKASRFPFCAVVMAATNQRIALLQQVEGPKSPEEMLTILQRVLEESGPVLVSARLEAEERRTNTRLREEQDAAYRAALEADQARERQRRLCSNFFRDVQCPERDVTRVDPELDLEGDASASGSANLMKSVENEPGMSIPSQLQVACPIENYAGHELSEPDPFIFDPQLDPQRSMPVVESNDEHVQMITEQFQVTCHLEPFQEPIEPQTSNCSSQNSIEVPASSSDVGPSDEPTSLDSIKNRGHILDDPSQEPEKSEPQAANPYSPNLIEGLESSSDLGQLDNLTALDSVKNQLGHAFSDPSQEPTGSQTSDPSSPDLFEVPESSSELKFLDTTLAFDSVKNLPGHLCNDSSREKIEPRTRNPSSKNSVKVPESLDMVLLEEPTAFSAVKNQQIYITDSPRAPVSVHLLEGGQCISSLVRTDGALTEEKAAKFWKENARHGKSSTPEVYLISSVEKDLCEADFLSIHRPSDNNANTASLAPNKLSPADSVHAEEDLVPSDNFTVETVCSIGASNTITSSDMSSPVVSHEEEAKTMDLESLSNPVEVESYESEILPEVSFQRGSSCDDEVGIVRCVPRSSSFTPFALSGGSVENASGFSDTTSLTEAYQKEHIQCNESAEFHDLSFSSDKDEEAKLGESCVALDSRELYALSLRIQRTRSFKKKIMDTFAPRQRTVKEYEQLGIWYEDSQIESECNRRIEHTTPQPAISAFSDPQSSQEHQIDSDWELL